MQWELRRLVLKPDRAGTARAAVPSIVRGRRASARASLKRGVSQGVPVACRAGTIASTRRSHPAARRERLQSGALASRGARWPRRTRTTRAQRSFTEGVAALARGCWLFGPRANAGPRASRPSRAVLRRRSEGIAASAQRAPGLAAVRSLPSGRSPDNPRGIIGSRALWPSGTRACRKRAADLTLAGHAAGSLSFSSASRAPIERASLFSGPRRR